MQSMQPEQANNTLNAPGTSADVVEGLAFDGVFGLGVPERLLGHTPNTQLPEEGDHEMSVPLSNPQKNFRQCKQQVQHTAIYDSPMSIQMELANDQFRQSYAEKTHDDEFPADFDMVGPIVNTSYGPQHVYQLADLSPDLIHSIMQAPSEAVMYDEMMDNT